MRKWDPVSGECIQTFASGHKSVVTCMLCDSDVLVTGSSKGRVLRWDPDSGVVLHTFAGHKETITCLVQNVLASAGRVELLSGSADNTVRVWNMSNGTCLHVIRGHRDSITAIAVTRNVIFTASNDSAAIAWSQHDLKKIREMAGHTDAVRALLPAHTEVSNNTRWFCLHTAPLSPHATATPQSSRPLLYTASADGTIRCFELISGNSVDPFHSARSTWPNVLDGFLKAPCLVAQLTAYTLTLPLAWPKVGRPLLLSPANVSLLPQLTSNAVAAQDGGASAFLQSAFSALDMLALVTDPLQLIAVPVVFSFSSISSLEGLELARWGTALVCILVRTAQRVRTCTPQLWTSPRLCARGASLRLCSPCC